MSVHCTVLVSTLLSVKRTVARCQLRISRKQNYYHDVIQCVFLHSYTYISLEKYAFVLLYLSVWCCWRTLRNEHDATKFYPIGAMRKSWKRALVLYSNSVVERYRTGPPCYIGWRNSFLGINPGPHKHLKVRPQYIPSKCVTNMAYLQQVSPLLFMNELFILIKQQKTHTENSEGFVPDLFSLIYLLYCYCLYFLLILIAVSLSENKTVKKLKRIIAFFHFVSLFISVCTVATCKHVHQRRHCFSALSLLLFCSASLAEAPRRGKQGKRSEAALCVPEEASCSEVAHPKGGAFSLSRGQKKESSPRREGGQRLLGSWHKAWNKLLPAQRL